MMTESVQPTGDVPLRRIESLAIEIPGETRSDSVDSYCDKYCSENMETKTKIYICLLLILPSLVYFLVSINSSHSKRIHVEHFEAPVILNITTFSEERYSTDEYAESFDLAVNETIRRYVATSTSIRHDFDDESTVYLLRRS
uniref:SEA domain-containing protein n=1 Tax=Caenorhabditis tropicalis TaxID=1561998 RepID=A0A1I7TK69_9PELO